MPLDRAGYSLLAGLLASTLLPNPLSAAPAPALPVPAPPLAATAATALPQDPAIRSLTLANGLRVFIRQTSVPAGSTSMRLWIGAGSLDERESERGLAHLLEHAALSGTTRFPAGSMVAKLQAAGLKLGPDTNAVTDFNQTVFKLDLPVSDAATIGLALDALADIAMAVEFTGTGFEQDKAVVLAEERTRTNPQLIFGEQALAFVFGNDLIARRLPIGTRESVGALSVDQARAFYVRHYRPDAAVLVVAGDASPELIEAEIRKRFATWKRPSSAREAVPAFAPGAGLEQVAVKTHADARMPPLVVMSWLLPVDTRPSTREKRLEAVRDALAVNILAKRISDRASESPSPFPAGFGMLSSPGRRAQLLEIGAVTGGDWRKALAALDEERRKIIVSGVEAVELDEALARLRAEADMLVSTDEGMPAPARAERILASVSTDEAAVSNATARDIINEAAKRWTARDLSVRIREMVGSAPRLIVTEPVETPGLARTVAEFWTAEAARPVAQAAEKAASSWPYTDFGPPGTVRNTIELPAVATTVVTFENGVRLGIRPSTIKKDQVLVTTEFGGGNRAEDPASLAAGLLWGLGAVQDAGLEKLDRSQLTSALAGKIVGVQPRVEDERFGLSGATRRQDLRTQFELLAAFVSAGGWRETSAERARQLVPAVLANLNGTPQGATALQKSYLLHSRDKRLAVPTADQVARVTMAEARKVLEPAMTGGTLDIAVAGDVDVGEVVRIAGATLGALRRSQAAAVPAPPLGPFPKPARETIYHDGQPEQAAILVAWPTPGRRADFKEARVLNLLSEVLELRLQEKIRQVLGMSYAPRSEREASDFQADYGFITAAAELDRSQLDVFRRELAGIVADLQARPVSATDLEKARQPLLEQMRKLRSSDNQFWVETTLELIDQPGLASDVVAGPEMMQSLTAADVQAAARKYLRAETRWEAETIKRP